MSDRTWVPVPEGSGFSMENLPYGVFSRPGETPRVGTRIGDQVLDLAALAADEGLDVAAHLRTPTLNAFMARGPGSWRGLRRLITARLTDDGARHDVQRHLHPVDEVSMHLPFAVGDYVDFYASEHHAANLGRIFRPDQEPLLPNWKHMPVAYHGRSGTIVPSGTPVVRPCGQAKPSGEALPVFGPTHGLDLEAEVGFVVGVASRLGTPVSIAAFRDHVFGVCLVNDWSARDIQSWEYVPLGPFLGKSFCTSISTWVVPLEALDHAHVAPPPRDPPLLPYLDDTSEEPWGLDIRLEVRLNGTVLSRPPFRLMYWTAAQELAHMTVNGASVRCGDLYASGTVSGPEEGQYGSLIELSWGGSRPVALPDGSTRTFLGDGDEVVITGTAPGPNGSSISFGEVAGRVEPAAERLDTSS